MYLEQSQKIWKKKFGGIANQRKNPDYSIVEIG